MYCYSWKNVNFYYLFITLFFSVTNFSAPYMSSGTAVVYLAFPFKVFRFINNNLGKFQEMFFPFSQVRDRLLANGEEPIDERIPVQDVYGRTYCRYPET
jgi:hypothetical protein